MSTNAVFRRLTVAATLALCALLWLVPTAFAQNSSKPDADPNLMKSPDQPTTGTVTKSAPPKRKNRLTGVRGTIVDIEHKLPLEGVRIMVVKGGIGETRSDALGKYFLQLKPGTYDLRIVYDIYESRRVRVVVGYGRPVRLNVKMSKSTQAIQVVVISGRAVKRTEAGVLQLRKKSSTVSDSLSAQEMSRSADSSAAGAVKRVVSATVVGGRYVLVRGLGGRYMTTLLNGALLPSPEPDKQAVPLDMFPTSLLANLTVAKSYSVRNPGTFAGGTLQIETNSYPSDFEFKVKVSTAGDSLTTLQDRRDYSGGSLQFFGFDDGTRALPDLVPRDQALRIGEGVMDASSLEKVAESFPNIWNTRNRTSYPNLSIGATVGDTTKVAGRKLGYLATLGISNSLSVRESEISKVKTMGDTVEYREQLTSVRGNETGKVGGLLNVGYQLSIDHELSLFWLYTHTGVSSATYQDGFNESDGEGVQSTRLKFIERYLNFTQLQGRHEFAKKVELRWQANVGLTHRDEPDTRDITYNLLDDGRLRFKNETGSGERFFSQLSELSTGAGTDVKVKLGRVTVRGGGTAQYSKRKFSARRFRYSFIGSDPNVLFLPPEQMFSDENVGEEFMLSERTLVTDAYDAHQTMLGAYTEADVGITDKLRAVGGVRFEVSDQELTPGSPYGSGVVGPDDVTARTDKDFLPAASMVYALTPKMNLRAAYSWTLARPRFRELAKFLYIDYARRRAVSGNPLLKETRIHNADLRWEWFFGETELVAASLFYKNFRNPIEQVIVSAANGDVSFANAASATAIGAELEGRIGLSLISPALARFKVGANLSLIKSKIELTEDQVMSQTSKERPLQGQSPYVVNATIGYEDKSSGLFLNAFYNVSGRRIAEVGFDSLPDVYEQPFHRLDVAGSKRIGNKWKLKLAATNLLNQKVQLKQGPLQILGYQPGVAVKASLEWSY